MVEEEGMRVYNLFLLKQLLPLKLSKPCKEAKHNDVTMVTGQTCWVLALQLRNDVTF